MPCQFLDELVLGVSLLCRKQTKRVSDIKQQLCPFILDQLLEDSFQQRVVLCVLQLHLAQDRPHDFLSLLISFLFQLLFTEVSGVASWVNRISGVGLIFGLLNSIVDRCL